MMNMINVTKISKGILPLLFIFICLSQISYAEHKTALPQDYKEAICEKQKQINSATAIQSNDKGQLMVELASLFLKDQDQERAFQTFLNALENTQIEQNKKDNPEQEQIYQKALAVYFDHNGGSTKEKAQNIITEFEPTLKDHPYAHQLAYLIAIAHANLNQYDQFFSLFYNSYRVYPQHFLAYKTKAILHIKLFERARTESERELQREAISKNLELALEKEPRDDTLYKLLITFSSPEKKQEQVRRSLNKIHDANIMISRCDIMFFVQEAVDAQEYSLAKRMLEKARGWYQQSKIITAAQKYLDAHMPTEQ